jgi:putative FmdB family regulatory protein
MPLYEYQCTKCGVRFEKIQKFSDPLVDTCPTCGGKVEKLLSAPAFTFKGSGFYITDYSRKGETAAGEKAERAGKSGKSSESGESKESKESKESGKSQESGKSEASAKSEPAKVDSGGKTSDAASAPAAKPSKSE